MHAQLWTRRPRRWRCARMCVCACAIPSADRLLVRPSRCARACNPMCLGFAAAAAGCAAQTPPRYRPRTSTTASTRPPHPLPTAQHPASVFRACVVFVCSHTCTHIALHTHTHTAHAPAYHTPDIRPNRFTLHSTAHAHHASHMRVRATEIESKIAFTPLVGRVVDRKTLDLHCV